MDPNRKATRKALAEPVPQASGSRWNEEDEAQASTFKALTREQAQALRAKDPPLSPWRVIVLQLVVGLAFYVKDMFGLKLHQKHRQEALEKKLRQAIAEGAERASA